MNRAEKLLRAINEVLKGEKDTGRPPESNDMPPSKKQMKNKKKSPTPSC